MDDKRIPFGKTPFGDGNVIIKLSIKRSAETIKLICSKFNLLYRPSVKGNTVIYGIIPTHKWDDFDNYLMKTKLRYDIKVAQEKYTAFKKGQTVGKIPLKSEDLMPDDLPF